MIRALTIFIWVWLGLVAAIFLLALVVLFSVTPSFEAAIGSYTDLDSPINPFNLFAFSLLLLPALPAWILRVYLRRRRDEKAMNDNRR